MSRQACHPEAPLSALPLLGCYACLRRHVCVKRCVCPATCRYIVIPARPAGTEGWSEAQLLKLVTRDSMIGVAPAMTPDQVAA
jgi:hypothetical protein